ncbi:hypothetical protein AB0387_25835 [Streptomyces sp. NPDC089173]|uniref:hypothetical protein n=1 Tax=Streptomyces sp. NPDC089173 TaxID=3154965 RepID=UPI00344BB23F
MTAADMERLDTPLDALVAQVDATTAANAAARAARRLAEANAENQHLLYDADPTDTAFALLPCPHPELCSTDADYPEWAAELAEQIRASNLSRRTP